MSCPEVMTQTGLVRGLEQNGVFKFRGIPYCKPTTGEGRFKPAEPAQPWQGVRLHERDTDCSSGALGP